MPLERNNILKVMTAIELPSASVNCELSTQNIQQTPFVQDSNIRSWLRTSCVSDPTSNQPRAGRERILQGHTSSRDPPVTVQE